MTPVDNGQAANIHAAVVNFSRSGEAAPVRRTPGVVELLAHNMQRRLVTRAVLACRARTAMSEHSERDVLHHLIEICSDGALGFRMAAGQVGDPDLRALFIELADERSRFAADLIPHLQRMGGVTDTDGTSKGAVHRGWMTLRSFASHSHDHAIVVEAERGERAALSAYDRALAGLLPLTVDWLVEAQREAVRKAHDRIASFGARP